MSEFTLLSEKDTPVGWRCVSIGEFRQCRSRTFNPSGEPNSLFELYSIPSHATGQPEEVLAKDIGSNKQYVDSGDVLISRINPRLNRTWVVMDKNNLEQIASIEWIVFPRNLIFDSKYLATMLSDARLRNFLVTQGSGVGGSLTRIRPELFDHIDLPLPPQNEQRRIVAKIEDLFTELERGAKTLIRAREQLKLYRQSVLKHAFEGKLTADWRKANKDKLDSMNQLPATLTRTLQDRTNGIGGKSDLPKGWIECTFGDVTIPVKMTTRNDPDRDIWYIDISSIDSATNKITEPKRLRLSKAPSRARQKIQTGDVLFSTVRPYLRKIAAVSDQYDGEIASTGFAVLRPAKGINPRFLFYKSLSRDFVSALTGEQYGVSYPAVKDGQVMVQPFPLPSPTEQRQIVTEIEQAFSKADYLASTIDDALTRTEVLRQSILKQAFSGRLVPQDPADEPASALLARIKAGKNS